MPSPSDQKQIQQHFHLAITMGDPAGIGPELCLKYLASSCSEPYYIPLIFGDFSILKRVANHLNQDLTTPVFSWKEYLKQPRAMTQATIIDMQSVNENLVQPGKVDALHGRAAYLYIERAIEQAIRGNVDAIVTNPIHKEALHQAGISYPGHTELLQTKTSSDSICMMLTSEKITCSLVTAHVGYEEVPALLNTKRILEVIHLTKKAMQAIRGRSPRLTLCGLNPHAGEHGLFGNREEERIILPAVMEAKKQGIDITGPLPADTAFVPAIRKRTDAYICMYHDQGLIPLKAISFDNAVNITLGLPIIRTSVDHGTAFDIAWQGVANVNSLIQAVKLASKLVNQTLSSFPRSTLGTQGTESPAPR